MASSEQTVLWLPDALRAAIRSNGKKAARFNDQVDSTLKTLRAQYQQPQQFGFGPQGIVFIGTPVQQALGQRVPGGAIPYDVISPVEMRRVIAQVAIDDFKRTQSTHQANNGWG
jgi:hypothetical protein